MGEWMEEMKKSPGRPTKENKKIHLPAITLNEDTIIKMNDIALQRGKSQSEIYQEALDSYIAIVERNKNVVRL